jgi:Zn-dependent peptidase ImmA (M78 family)
MAKADEVAEMVLGDLGQRRLPIDVEEIAKGRGALIVRQDFAKADVSGMLLREPGRTIIGVNSTHSSVRQRFTIAHELGHLELHRGRKLIMDTPVRVNFRDRTSGLATDQEEVQANRFAATLLMPQELVIREARVSSHRSVDALIKALAATFQVSKEAMSYRLVNLGVLT